jgi:Ca2+-binding RTX toxin-like protein
MAWLTTYQDPVDMSSWNVLSDFATGSFMGESATKFLVKSNGETYVFAGTDFTYDSNGDVTGGTITHIRAIDQSSGEDNYRIGGLNLSIQQFETFAQTNDLTGFENAVFGGNDVFHTEDDTSGGYFEGFGGNDVFQFSTPVIVPCDGGGGYNTVVLSSGYGYLFQPGLFENIQKIVLEPGTYDIIMQNFTSGDPDNISGGKPLTIDGHLLTAADRLNFQTVDEAVHMNFIGGAGNDTLYGGTGSNTFYGGMGLDDLGGFEGHNNTYIYHSVAESTGIGADLINGFNAKTDHFEIPTAVTGVDAAITGGSLNFATFDTDLAAAVQGHLEAYHAILFTPDSSSALNGTIALVIDQNGIPGYQDGGDLVMFLAAAHSPNLSHLSVSDFTVWPG